MSTPDLPCRHPACRRRVGRVPSPIPQPPVAALSRASGVVKATRAKRGQSIGQHRVAGLDLGLPVRSAVERGKRGVVGLEQEAGAPGHLRHRRRQAEIPYSGGDDVGARLQQGREIVSLETPVLGVAAAGSGARALPVDVENVALVARHVHAQPGWDGFKSDGASKVVDAGIALGRAGRGDPRGRPLSREQRRVDWLARLWRRCRRRGERGKKDDGQNASGVHRRPRPTSLAVAAAAVKTQRPKVSQPSGEPRSRPRRNHSTRCADEPCVNDSGLTTPPP